MGDKKNFVQSNETCTDLVKKTIDVTECIQKLNHSSRCVSCIEDSMMLVLKDEFLFADDYCRHN